MRRETAICLFVCVSPFLKVEAPSGSSGADISTFEFRLHFRTSAETCRGTGEPEPVSTKCMRVIHKALAFANEVRDFSVVVFVHLVFVYTQYGE